MFGIFLYMEKWYIGYFQLIHKNKQKSQEQMDVPVSFQMF